MVRIFGCEGEMEAVRFLARLPLLLVLDGMFFRLFTWITFKDSALTGFTVFTASRDSIVLMISSQQGTNS